MFEAIFQLPLTAGNQPNPIDSYNSLDSWGLLNIAGLSGFKAALQAVRQSPILLGVVFVASINLAFTALNPVSKVDPQSLPTAHGWTWWAAHDFLKEKAAPNVVIAGSSLMMNPIWQNEADFLEQDVDITANRRCRYLESAIARQLPHMQARCFNMALPGAMISDDYMVARSLLTGAHKPKILILGLSPRDFIDSGFKYPACSDHYRYLQHFIKSDDLSRAGHAGNMAAIFVLCSQHSISGC